MTTNQTATAEVRSNDGLGGWVPVSERMPASGQTALVPKRDHVCVLQNSC
jgi:hypothetical protein